MYVKIDRDYCDHQIAVCERCLGKFLKNPYGYERQCFLELVEDGSDLVTLDIVSSDHDSIHLVLNEEQRLMIAGEGWAKVLELAGIL